MVSAFPRQLALHSEVFVPSARPPSPTGCGQYGQGLAVKDRHAERDHCHGDEAVEDAPCGRALRTGRAAGRRRSPKW